MNRVTVTMKRFLPVLHLKDLNQALEQTQLLVDNGADGVFLIHHAAGYQTSIDLFNRVRESYPKLWLGINILDLSAPEALAVMTTPDAKPLNALWSDNSGVTDRKVSPQARDTWSIKKTRQWPGEYFGSVAFKVGPLVDDPAKAAENARDVMDVVVTSGVATGEPADINKVKAMKRVLGNQRLALASGVTPENVSEYLPFVDDFLVATGISRTWHTFDPVKVRSLAERIRGWQD